MREGECVCERESVCERREREMECVCVRGREKVCVREGETERESV